MVTKYQVYDRISKALAEKYENIQIRSQYINAPGGFPYVFMREIDSTPIKSHVGLNTIMTNRRSTYSVSVYDKSDLKVNEIIDFITKEFMDIGYHVQFCGQIDNVNDTEIRRYEARYQRVFGSDDVLPERG